MTDYQDAYRALLEADARRINDSEKTYQGAIPGQAHANGYKRTQAMRIAAEHYTRLRPMVLSYLRSNPGATTLQITGAIRTSKSTASRLLLRMLNDGEIKMGGLSNLRMWRVADDA